MVPKTMHCLTSPTSEKTTSSPHWASPAQPLRKLDVASRPTPVPLAARKAAWAAGVQAEQTATQLAQRQTEQFRADEPAPEPPSPELVQGYIADRHPKFGDLYR